MASFDLMAARMAAYRAVDLAFDYLENIAERPVYQRLPDGVRGRFTEAPLPTRGLSLDEILDEFDEAIAPYPMGNGHPRFFGWIASPPNPAGPIADLLAATLNPAVSGGDHAAVRWVMDLIGFPSDGSRGLLVSGGSMASLTGLAAARNW